ncbi:hypothetical protein KA344_16470 [bacterium]|jgi:hypothetical protein|nr:hypothetical protein [bacterium]
MARYFMADSCPQKCVLTIMLENNHPRHTVRAQGKARFASPTDAAMLYRPLEQQASIANQDLFANESQKYGRLLNYLSKNASQGERQLLDHSSVAALGSSSTGAQMLEAWLNSGNFSDQEDVDGLEETSLEGYWPKTDFEASDDSLHFERGRRDLAGQHGAGGPGAFLRGIRNSRSLSSNRTAARTADNSDVSGITAAIKMRPRVEIKESGSGRGSVETFPSGAKVVKDDIGRVQEIVSDRGVCVVLGYDDKGHLCSFVRHDASGVVHSQGEVDGPGVLVRDGRGRVKAQGESMQVDARGCVSIAREDGQFWSIDLIRSVHTERRLLPDANGDWISMTALFCSDGFRMTTRFRKVQALESEALNHCARANQGSSQSANARAASTSAATAKASNYVESDFSRAEDSGTYRFYGRDGSIIDFNSDSELEQLKPKNVLPPGSKPVPAAHRGKRQAGTAWEALREYVFNYLADL